jgi:ectoine hydroxylase-related dioxygenase (phytanoyl-CoA dioxygenase family)
MKHRTSGSSSAAFDAAIDQVESEGWAILPDLIPPELVDRLRTGAERTIERSGTRYGANVFLGHHTRRVFNLLSHDPVFAEVPIRPDVLRIAERVLDEDLLLSSLTAIETHPGQAAQPLHADDGSIPLARPHEPLLLIAMWALTDFTAENGGTRLVPRSHLADRRPRTEEVAATVGVEMSAGSVLVYNGSLWHGGGGNRSADRRMGIVCNYCAGWLRQEESQILGLTRERVAEFPPRLQRLVGYGVYRGLQGHVAGVNPGAWVNEDTESDLVWNRMR